MADSMEPRKLLWGRPLLPWHGNEIWARRGEPVAYRLVGWLVRSFITLVVISGKVQLSFS